MHPCCPQDMRSGDVVDQLLLTDRRNRVIVLLFILRGIRRYQSTHLNIYTSIHLSIHLSLCSHQWEPIVVIGGESQECIRSIQSVDSRGLLWSLTHDSCRRYIVPPLIDMEQPNEETTKVIKYLIQSCPYGEEQEVLKDIDKLTSIDLASITEDLRHHNEDHLAIVSNTEGRIITFKPAYSEGRYIDQLRGKAYTVDHQAHTITSAEAVETGLPEEAKEFLSGLESRLREYLTKYFKELHAVQVWCEESGEVRIGITAKNLNFANFYGGEWISQWTLAGTELQGSVKVHAHFFEGGNVQLHQSKILGPVDVPHSENPSQRVGAIVSAIEKLEGSLQSSLETLFEEIPDQFFRCLRRTIPFTKTKMDWNVATLTIKQNLQSMTSNNS